MFKKSRLKFIAINMLLVSLVLLLIMIAVMFSKYNRLEVGSYNMLAGILYTPDKFASKYPYFPENIDVNIFVANVSNQSLIDWHTKYGETDNATAIKAIEQAIKTNDTRGKLKELGINFSSRKTEKGSTYAFIGTEYINKTLTNESFSLIIIGIGSLGLFFLISLYLSSYALKPVEKVWERQKQFYVNASHELKTPISVVLANTSILLAKKDNFKSDNVKWIQNIESEMKRMHKLVEGLLFLAKSDEATEKAPKTVIHLNDIVLYCILQFEPLAYETNINVINQITDTEVKIIGSANEIKQLIMILLDNAFKYGGSNSSITISLNRVANKAILSINNTGGPIPVKDLEFLFDRFYRGDKSRNREKGSVGLGLAIAKEIVKSHNGEIKVRSSLEKGTTFDISLPICK